MLNKLWDWIKKLFGKTPIAEDDNSDKARSYEDTTRVSVTAIFADALAKKVVTDSDIIVTALNGKESRRSEWIGVGIKKIIRRLRRAVTQALGKGGAVLVPCVINGVAHVDIIGHDRLVISRMEGGKITSATILAATAKVGDKKYFRWQDYTVEGESHTMRVRVTNEQGAEVGLDAVPEWANITPEIVTQGVDRALFAYLKSPKSSRKDADIYGEPITYGCNDLMERFHKCLEDIDREYDLKKAFVGADERLFGKGEKLPPGGLFKKFAAAVAVADKPFWELFDPAIRDSSYFNLYNLLCAMLEKAVGTSRGILTEPTSTAGATATEIRAALYDTYVMVSSIRENIESAFADLAYALDVLAESFGATPSGARGDYLLAYDWDLSMLESSSETFTQLSELESRGLILPERLTAWVTGDSKEEALKEIEEAQARVQARAVSAIAEFGAEQAV
ncbi:MAG: hypothetical protein VB049_04955 [Candidatus Pelethousia sp.]|nr:hypothetical protein [Candidatus Pelethousia sp.]